MKVISLPLCLSHFNVRLLIFIVSIAFITITFNSPIKFPDNFNSSDWWNKGDDYNDHHEYVANYNDKPLNGDKIEQMTKVISIIYDDGSGTNHLKMATEVEEKGIRCFYQEISNEIKLFDVKEVIKGAENIFFHETSCFNNNIAYLNARKACAVESAARMNRASNIYLLYTAAVTFPVNASKDNYITLLNNFSNVKIRRLKLHTYIHSTPLEKWFKTGALKKSNYGNSHTSDVLRYLTIWKFGGTYLDLDMISMKNLEYLPPNFAGAEDDYYVAAGIINIRYGHLLSSLCLKYFQRFYNPKEFSFNGPGILKLSLNHLCNTTKPKEMKGRRCLGFTAYDPKNFYPISVSEWRSIFNPKKLDHVLNKINESYTIHMWNKFSGPKKQFKNKLSPYTALAEQYCPSVYKAIDNQF